MSPHKNKTTTPLNLKIFTNLNIFNWIFIKKKHFIEILKLFIFLHWIFTINWDDGFLYSKVLRNITNLENKKNIVLKSIYLYNKLQILKKSLP